jgi:hypothetical protein
MPLPSSLHLDVLMINNYKTYLVGNVHAIPALQKAAKSLNPGDPRRLSHEKAPQGAGPFDNGDRTGTESR